MVLNGNVVDFGLISNGSLSFSVPLKFYSSSYRIWNVVNMKQNISHQLHCWPCNFISFNLDLAPRSIHTILYRQSNLGVTILGGRRNGANGVELFNSWGNWILVVCVNAWTCKSILGPEIYYAWSSFIKHKLNNVVITQFLIYRFVLKVYRVHLENKSELKDPL